MFLIVGLGNPGRKYKRTRHNFGFRVLDQLRQTYCLPRFKLNKKLQSELSAGALGDKEVILAKPQTFMNESGKAVKAVFNFYKIPLENLIVVHDELDLVLGEIKTSEARGAAGHKGIESIIGELGTQNFIRLRLGIRPGADVPGLVHVPQKENFVLRKFSKDEEAILEPVIKKSAEALAAAVGLTKMNC